MYQILSHEKMYLYLKNALIIYVNGLFSKDFLNLHVGSYR